MIIRQGNNVTKTGKRCYKSRENPVIETLERWNQYREIPVHWTGMHPVMCVFVLIFMIFFSFYRVQWTGISLYWLQFFYVPTTELEGLLWYPVIFTGSLQGRITTQGDPCNRYREWVCSVIWPQSTNFGIFYLLFIHFR